ncbi:MAG: HAD family hydrolase [Akkermansiaceae bacterium]
MADNLPLLTGIKHLAFDLYGTLLISKAGGSYSIHEREFTLRNHLAEYNYSQLPIFPLVTHLENIIAQDHAHSRKNGIDFPEVEIRHIWPRFFDSLKLTPPTELERFIIEYENLTNPVSPAPGSLEILTHPLTRAFVSNAQFYTPLILTQLELPAPNITLYSYQAGHAKPGRHLFDALAKSIPPSETLYIGNDRLKDIAPAHHCGFRTALYAGDQNAFRPYAHRTDLPQPDVLITSLDQIHQILGERLLA